jgi:hypothetical protein
MLLPGLFFSTGIASAQSLRAHRVQMNTSVSIKKNLKKYSDMPVNGSFTVDGNDTITTATSNIASGYVQFSLASAFNVTWWKGIKVQDNAGNEILLLETQDASHGPILSPLLNIGQFGQQINVEIWKAKEFGRHRLVDMVTFNTNDCNGHNITLTWQND